MRRQSGSGDLSDGKTVKRNPGAAKNAFTQKRIATPLYGKLTPDVIKSRRPTVTRRIRERDAAADLT